MFALKILGPALVVVAVLGVLRGFFQGLGTMMPSAISQIIEQIVNAMAFALKNMLGLTCDPVCGLVEVPCIKRNSAGAVNAVTSAQMALAGVCSAIAPDEVIDTMRRIGNALPACLKETSEGGLATTPSAQKVREKMDGE